MSAAPADPRRAWVIDCGTRYWPDNASAIATLPMPALPLDDQPDGAPIFVDLPDWAADLGIDGRLLAFAGCVAIGDGPPWQRCDWLAVAWHMLTASAERAHETAHGPILSYALRLPAELGPVFERAWVNRIFLFLRRRAARQAVKDETELFGPLPRAEIMLTHDIDAISLTPEIRAKQAAFQLLNAVRAGLSGRLSHAGRLFGAAARFGFARADLKTLALVRDMERAAGLRSLFHFYGGRPGFARGSPRRMLLDPAYDIGSRYMRTEIAALRDGGWQVGLHQSFDAWAAPEPMRAERARVEAAAGTGITACRQHWLHFSWERTWRAQQDAGLERDSTLGFNDRPGFRAGHALAVRPWDFATGAALQLQAVPMVFMDSHFYDYAGGSAPDPAADMKRWIGEIEAVRGQATLNWHPHTITSLYGWGSGFEALLELLR